MSVSERKQLRRKNSARMIHDVINGIRALRKKIAKRAVKMTSQEIDDLKKRGRRWKL